jgi:hypothetical protein
MDLMEMICGVWVEGRRGEGKFVGFFDWQHQSIAKLVDGNLRS